MRIHQLLECMQFLNVCRLHQPTTLVYLYPLHGCVSPSPVDIVDVQSLSVSRLPTTRVAFQCPIIPAPSLVTSSSATAPGRYIHKQPCVYLSQPRSTYISVLLKYMRLDITYRRLQQEGDGGGHGGADGADVHGVGSSSTSGDLGRRGLGAVVGGVGGSVSSGVGGLGDGGAVGDGAVGDALGGDGDGGEGEGNDGLELHG